jgi:hypothetical protein
MVFAVWAIALEFRFGRVDNNQGGSVPMKEEHSRLYESIAEKIKSRGRNREANTACRKVLDDIIRPAITHVSQKIEIRDEMAEFHPEDRRPYIRVSGDELRFICAGNSVDIETQIGSISSRAIYSIDEITEDVVHDKIVHFFSRLYD